MPGFGPGIPFFFTTPSLGFGVPAPGVLPGTGVPFDSDVRSAGGSSAAAAGVEMGAEGDLGSEGGVGVADLGWKGARSLGWRLSLTIKVRFDDRPTSVDPGGAFEVEGMRVEGILVESMMV